MAHKDAEAVIIGAGRAARVLRGWLAEAGLRVEPFVRRGRRPRRAAVLVLAVPDDAIAPLAEWLAQAGEWEGTTVFHLSGALGSASLAALRRRGARVASMHPLMTFGRGRRPPPRGVVFALEGDAAACRRATAWIHAWRGTPLRLRAEQKAAYHLAATLVSPGVVAAFAAAEAVLKRGGLGPGAQAAARRGLVGLLQATAANLEAGTEAGWTGPWARGDVGTVALHASALRGRPQLGELYRALARAGNAWLPTNGAQRLHKALSGGFGRASSKNRR